MLEAATAANRTMLKLTRDMIFAGASSAGGWSRQQLLLLGVPWPPKSGWLKARIGVAIEERTYMQFLALKGIKKRKHRDTETLELFGNGAVTACNAPAVTRDQTAQDLANQLWETDPTSFDRVPQPAINLRTEPQ